MKSVVINTLIVIFVVLMCLSSCGWRGNGIPEEIIATENTEVDLGRIREKDGVVQTMLLVPNVSADTLFPFSTRTYCRCASALVDKGPVAPGENIKVELTYNPAYKKGVFMEEVVVLMNSGKIISLVVKGEVLPCEHPVEEDHPYDYGGGLHLSHETLHFGNLHAGEKRMIFIRYANDTKRKMTLSFRASPALSDMISYRNGIVVSRKCHDTLHFRFTMPEGVPAGDTLKLSLQPCLDGKPTGKILNVKAISPVLRAMD